MKAVLAGCALVFAGIVTADEAAAGDRYTKQKVVYHINYNGGEDDRAYVGALRNIQNHINAVGAENLDLRVVMHGNGVSLVLYPDSLASVPKFKNANADDQMQAKIANLKNQGVSFNVCANTLKGRKVDREQMLYDVDAKDIVPSGVAELAHLQNQGYSYVKP